MKHTPGPWEKRHSYGIEINIFGGDDLVAVAYAWEGQKKEGNANARLIAAAPDLLASGKARIEALEALLACYRLGKRATEKLLTQLEQSKKGWEAAIKKAEEED